MRLPRLEVKGPGSMEEALHLAAQYGQEGRLLGGGTELLVNLKKGLSRPRVLISLKNIQELKNIHADGAMIRIGPMVSLAALAGKSDLPAELAALREAADLVATPQIRNQGTVGGNVCIDTRCLYYNQSLNWLASLPLCFKRGGGTCHVVPRADRCYASFCGDTVAALVALGARVAVHGSAGRRVLDVEDLYPGRGEAPQDLKAGELLSEIMVPINGGKRGSAYIKFAYRAAMDFPLVGVAAGLTLTNDGKCAGVRIAAVGFSSRPERLRETEKTLTGQTMSEGLIGQAGGKAGKGLTIVAQHCVSTSYRRAMLETMTGRAVAAAWKRAQAALIQGGAG